MFGIQRICSRLYQKYNTKPTTQWKFNHNTFLSIMLKDTYYGMYATSVQNQQFFTFNFRNIFKKKKNRENWKAEKTHTVQLNFLFFALFTFLSVSSWPFSFLSSHSLFFHLTCCFAAPVLKLNILSAFEVYSQKDLYRPSDKESPPIWSLFWLWHDICPSTGYVCEVLQVLLNNDLKTVQEKRMNTPRVCPPDPSLCQSLRRKILHFPYY